MEESRRQELLAQTRQALNADDWGAVERLWQPWVEQGETEAKYQLAYHYLSCTPCDDDAACERMEMLLRDAAAKEHPDAMWFLASRRPGARESDPEYQQEMLRAGRLGSVEAQRCLGVMYATGEWTGPRDLAEAARWYRLAAEQGHPESQYDLGFMLLLGEGEPKNTAEGLVWLERAGEEGESKAFQLLADCYENGYYDVPADATRAALWRGREKEYARLHPPDPCRHYLVDRAISEVSPQDCLWEIEGVTGLVLTEGANDVFVFYDPAVTSPARLDEQIAASGIPARPMD